MKKIKLLIIVFICLFMVNVKADMGAPSVVSHKVVVTNKNGAACYEGDKKTGKVIPYGTTLDVYSDINGSYIYVSDEGNQYNCDVKYADVSAKNQTFTINNDNATKITPAKKAIILAKGGLNMRKGPAVTYSKITTIPEKTVVSVDYSSGSYWYHVTYNGKSGWVTGMDGYLGFEGKEVLVSYESIKMYSSNGKTVLGTIPANTEIDKYIELSGTPYSNLYYYVIYNGIKGYIKQGMLYKVDGTGKIKLNKDYTLYDDEGNANKKITAGQELEYTMKEESSSMQGFYIPAKKAVIYPEVFEYIKEAKILTKKEGYLGEGLFGEAKTEKIEPTETKEEETAEPENEVIAPVKEKTNVKDIIIIGLLAGIFAALTALVIIKLVNSKKKTTVIKKEPEKVQEEPVKEDQIKVPDKEIAKARIELAKEMNKIKPVEENNTEENGHDKEV